MKSRDVDHFAAVVAVLFFGGGLYALQTGHTITSNMMLAACFIITVVIYGRGLKNNE